MTRSPYSARAMELAAKTLDEIHDIERYPEKERMLHVLGMTAHMNFHLMSGIYQELVELRMTVERTAKQGGGK